MTKPTSSENTTKLHQQIITFLKENFITGRNDVKLENDASLIDNGIIDSTGVLELVMFMEETFSIEIDDEELIPENLDTINNIVKFLGKKGIQ